LLEKRIDLTFIKKDNLLYIKLNVKLAMHIACEYDLNFEHLRRDNVEKGSLSDNLLLSFKTALASNTNYAKPSLIKR